MAMMSMNVVCPAGATPGAKIPVQTPDGRLFQVEVPQGVSPGQQFKIQVPKSGAVPTTTGVPVTATPTPEQQTVHVVHHTRSYPSHYWESEDALDRAGQANAYCMIMLAVGTICLSLSLTQTVAWHFTTDDGTCYYDWRCCNAFCTRWCYYRICDSEWRYTRPISQDKFPEPSLAPEANTTNTVYEDEAGNGELDYWSLWVAVVLGTIGSIVVMLVGCAPTLNARRAEPKGLACGLVFAFICHVTSCICLGVQFFPVKKDELVYNYFRFPQYQTLQDESLVAYFINDKYYYIFGNCLMACWVFTCVLAIYEILFTFCLFKADKRVTRPSRSRGRNSSSRNDDGNNAL